MALGRVLILAGFVLVTVGLLVVALGKLNLPLGRLPGDLVWRGKNSTFYFPLMTCLVLSILGTALLWIFNRRP